MVRLFQPFFLLSSNGAVPSMPVFLSLNPACQKATQIGHGTHLSSKELSYFKYYMKLHPNLINLFWVLFALEGKEGNSVKAAFIPFRITKQ